MPPEWLRRHRQAQRARQQFRARLAWTPRTPQYARPRRLDPPPPAPPGAPDWSRN